MSETIGKCLCGCNRDIIYQTHHRRFGIPKYISGHYWKGRKAPHITKRNIEDNPIYKEGVKEKISLTKKKMFREGRIVSYWKGRKSKHTTERNFKNNPMKDKNTVKKMVNTHRSIGTYNRLGLLMKNPEIIRKIVQSQKRINHYENMSKKRHSLSPDKIKEIHMKIAKTNRENGTYIELGKRTKERNLKNNPTKNPLVVEKIVIANRKNGSYYKHGERIRTHPISKYCRSPSKPQKSMFEQIKKLFPQDEVFLNYKVKKENNGHYYLDVAIPRFFLNFEYDGKYWHNKTKENDKIRDTYLISKGWHIFRMEGK